ncbi:MAG: hypothetical protein HRU25_03300 [Psychrobium sp.]|nr:hypothetical protein [Psychrobium sp.]
MEINNANRPTNIAAITPINNIEAQTEQANDVAATSSIYLSDEGRLTSQLGATSDKVDSILLRYVSPEKKEQLSEIYQKLDQLFEKDQLTANEEDTANKLFEQVHNILDSSVSKLSTNERETIDSLVKKMDALEANLQQLDTSAQKEQNLTLVRGENANGLGLEKSASKKALTVAQLNALSAVELNKLPANQLKKLNAQQLNKLNASQLNNLSPAQHKLLSASNLEKIN